jgi:hypothetical protein
LRLRAVPSPKRTLTPWSGGVDSSKTSARVSAPASYEEVAFQKHECSTFVTPGTAS